MTVNANGLVRSILLSAFFLALVVGTWGLYLVLHERAVDRTALEAGRFLTTATAIRNYTDDHIAPVLQNTDDGKFHEQTVPAFAAQTVYRSVQDAYPGYTYREPALRPTNPHNLPTPFEVELINRFRADANLKELAGVRHDGGGEVYYLARPLRVAERCMVCHDTPERAPKALVAKYGPLNGFGWKQGEVIAIQSLTVPAAQELRETGEIATILGLALLVLFTVVYFALTMSIDAVIVRPLHALAAAAETASQTSETRVILPMAGASEIRTLAEAIHRLRLSLAKAINRLPRVAAEPGIKPPAGPAGETTAPRGDTPP
jgi:hypothetical protein